MEIHLNEKGWYYYRKKELLKATKRVLKGKKVVHVLFSKTKICDQFKIFLFCDNDKLPYFFRWESTDLPDLENLGPKITRVKNNKNFLQNRSLCYRICIQLMSMGKCYERGELVPCHNCINLENEDLQTYIDMIQEILYDPAYKNIHL